MKSLKVESRLIYDNVNPEHKEINDCVCRAISLASGMPYEEVEEKLFFSAKLLDCEKLCVCCYSFLLDDYFKFKRVYAEGMTINEFADYHPRGIYIVRVNQHLSCIIDGFIHDIWDCGEEIITDSWMVEY